MTDKPNTADVLQKLSEYTKQYQDGLITEAEWAAHMINKLLAHHRDMQQFSIVQMLQWQSVGSINHT